MYNAERHKRLINLIQDYFEEVDWKDDQLWNEAWILTALLPHSGDILRARIVDQEQAIRKIEPALETLHEAFSALHPKVRNAGLNFSSYLVAQLYASLTGRSPDPSSDSIVDKLRNPDGDLKQMQKAIERLHDLHHRQRDNRLPEKIQLVRLSRRIWETYKKETLPLYPIRNRDYCNFVEDLIEELTEDKDKKWGLERVLQKYKDHVENGGVFDNTLLEAMAAHG